MKTNKRKLQHLFYETRKRALLPILQFVKWLIAKLNTGKNITSKAIAQNVIAREVAQTVSEVVKKYDHRKGRVVWRSRVWGTYVRAIHGTLK